MQWKLDRIISVTTLVCSVGALVLVLKKPQPVAVPQPPAAAAANAQSMENKLEQLEQPKAPGQAPAQVRFSSDEIAAVLAQAAAALPAAAQSSPGSPAAVPTDSALPTSVPSSHSSSSRG